MISSSKPLRLIRFPLCINMSTWQSSQVLTDKKSKFQGHSISLKSAQEVPQKLSELINTNKSIQKSSHPTMYAFRIGRKDPTGDVIEEQGSRDCGENAAGARLMTLLERSGLVNVLVVVTRWYGGVPLGSARFKDITEVAVEALKAGGFYEQSVDNRGGGTKKKR